VCSHNRFLSLKFGQGRYRSLASGEGKAGGIERTAQLGNLAREECPKGQGKFLIAADAPPARAPKEARLSGEEQEAAPHSRHGRAKRFSWSNLSQVSALRSFRRRLGGDVPCFYTGDQLWILRSAPPALKRYWTYNANGLVYTLFGTLSGAVGSEGFAINDSDQVAGVASYAGGQLQAFVYSSGVMTGLGTLYGAQPVPLTGSALRARWSRSSPARGNSPSSMTANARKRH